MKKTLVLASVLAVCAAPAFANDMKDHHKWMEEKADTMFKEVDANGDGMISKAEHEAFAEKMFSDADTNKDGSISKEECRAMHKKEMDKHHMARDKSMPNREKGKEKMTGPSESSTDTENNKDLKPSGN